MLNRYLWHLIRAQSKFNAVKMFEIAEDLPSNSGILDIGCGDFPYLDQLISVLRTRRITGMEIMPELAAKARAKGVNIICANVDDGLPFNDESFDCVVSNQVLEHLDNTDLFFKEIYRVLKPNGLALISTPNLAGLHNVISLVLGFQPFSTAVSDRFVLGVIAYPLGHELDIGMRNHRRVFTSISLKAMAEMYGFQVEKLIGWGMDPLPLYIQKYIHITRYSKYLIIKLRKPLPGDD